MHDFLNVWVFGLAAASLRSATPLVFAALGGMWSERSGVVNIALEGGMIVGAFFAIFGSDHFGSWIPGLILAVVAGGALMALHAIAAIRYRADQIVIGTALILFASGLTSYLYRTIYGAGGTPTEISRVPSIPAPGDQQISLLVVLMAILLIGSGFVLFRTAFGLHVRSVGEHPRAADTVGISVYKIRYVAVIASGMFAALGGAYIAMDVGSFNEGMTANRGFIALAAVIFGGWSPTGLFGASLLFGFSQALGQRLQNYGIPSQLLDMMPYVFTLVALAGFVGKTRPPAAVGQPYTKGGR